MNSFRTDIAQGRPPVKSMADSIGLLCGAVLMLLPGYVTDAVGLAIFVPGIRTMAGLWLATRLGKSARFTSYAGAAHAQTDNSNAGFDASRRRSTFGNTPDQWGDNDIIEGEAEEKTPNKASKPNDPGKTLK
jgi:UPF0716 protein FxsA